MKIGIMADSHDRLPFIKRAVDIFNKEKVDRVLHSGDFVSPFVIRELKNLNCKLIGVFGNNDGDKLYLRKKFGERNFEIYEGSLEIELGGRKIVMMHTPDTLKALEKSGYYDIIIYGHTHEVDIRRGKSLVINPGESSGWLSGKATVVILDLDSLEPKLIEL
jgi:hypothetical protein